MWYARFMRCKRDIGRLAAMSELKLDDANPVRAGRGETRVRRGAQGLLTRSGKAVRRSITKRTSPMTGAGGFAAYKRRCTEESEAFGGNLAEGDPKGAQAGARAKSVKA